MHSASIIITSLAAKIARNVSLYALEELLPYIANGIVHYASLLNEETENYESIDYEKVFMYKKDSKWYIPNPVDPEDNYADSWTNDTAKAFFEWTSAIKRDLSDTTCINEANYLIGLQTSFGKDYVNSTLGLSEQKVNDIKSFKITQPSKPWRENE